MDIRHLFTTLAMLFPTSALRDLVYSLIRKGKELIADSETQTDDKYLLPILEAAELAIDEHSDVNLSIGYLAQFIASFSTTIGRTFFDVVFDICEEKILGSRSTLDDRLVLPVIAGFRKAFNIPDDD